MKQPVAVILRSRQGSPVTHMYVDGDIGGALAVTPSIVGDPKEPDVLMPAGGRYTVTHIPTGRRVGRDGMTRHQAQVVRERLAAMPLDWSALTDTGMYQLRTVNRSLYDAILASVRDAEEV